MYKLGIIEESLEHAKILELIKSYFFSQRLETVKENEYPIWHIKEYHVPDEKIADLLNVLKDEVKLTWYLHAFSDSELFVILRGKYFAISLQRDDTWDEMIDYGIKTA